MKLGKLKRYAVLLLMLGVTVSCNGMDERDTTISPPVLLQQLQSSDKPLIIDVRTPQEYHQGHVPSAINIPHTEIGGHLMELSGYKDKPIVVYCKSGRRAQIAIDTLTQAGFSRILHLEGDMGSWATGNYPQER